MPKVSINIHEIFSSLCHSGAAELLHCSDLKKVQDHLGQRNLIRAGQYPELMLVHDTELRETYLYFVDACDGDIVSDLVKFDSLGQAKMAPPRVVEDFLRPLLRETE